MAVRITDSRHQMLLNAMCAAFQKDLAYDLSPDVPANAAPGGMARKGKVKATMANNRSEEAKAARGGSRDDEKPHGTVFPWFIHNSNVHKKTRPCPYGDHCRISHSIMSFAEFCKMPPPPSAMNDGYTPDSSCLYAASSVHNSRTRKPTCPSVRHGIACKKGVCAKGYNCARPRLPAAPVAANQQRACQKARNGMELKRLQQQTPKRKQPQRLNRTQKLLCRVFRSSPKSLPLIFRQNKRFRMTEGT